MGRGDTRGCEQWVCEGCMGQMCGHEWDMG